MIFKLTNISVILLITTGINLVTSFLSWQRRNTKGGIYFSWGMFAITFWTFTAALDYAAVPIATKVFFAKLETIGYNSALALLGWFALSYVGYEYLQKRVWVKTMFTIIPLSNISLAWTNNVHGLLWSDFSRTTSDQNIVIFHHGEASNAVRENIHGFLISI